MQPRNQLFTFIMAPSPFCAEVGEDVGIDTGVVPTVDAAERKVPDPKLSTDAPVPVVCIHLTNLPARLGLQADQITAPLPPLSRVIVADFMLAVYVYPPIVRTVEKASSCVLAPIIKPSDVKDIGVLLTTRPGPPSDRVMPAMEKAVGLAVNVWLWPAIVKTD